MAKFILCSKKNDYMKLKNMIKVNFQESSTCNGEFGYLSTFRKLRIDTKNYYSNGTDFAAGVGTFFYNNKKDKEALHDILVDFEGNINILRSKIVGSYCIIIRKENKICIFVDPASTYNVYYKINDNNEIIVTTTYYHLGLICEKFKVDRYMFIAEWLHSILREATMFEGIYRLTGDKALIYNTKKWEICNIGYPKMELEKNICDEVKEMYISLRNFAKTSIFLTGGQDSRLSLALLLSLGLKPLVCYGQGDSSDTSTKQKDLDIVQKIALKYDLPIHYMNWNDSDKNDEEKYLNKYGELYTIYCMNKNFMKEFEEKLDTDFVCFGYFGEVFRIIETIEYYNKSEFSLQEYIDDLYLSGNKELFKPGCYEIYCEKIYTLLLEICKISSLDEKHLKKNDFQKLNTVYRQRWDTQLNNFANLFTYSCPLFGDKKITDLAEAENYENKINSKYQMKLIFQLKKDLLEIPFFSHIKVKKFNAKTFELTDANILVSRGKELIRTFIKQPLILYTLKKIYYILQKDEKGLKEIRNEWQKKEDLKSKFAEKSILDPIININMAVNKMDARRIKYAMLLNNMILQIDLHQKRNNLFFDN